MAPFTPRPHAASSPGRSASAPSYPRSVEDIELARVLAVALAITGDAVLQDRLRAVAAIPSGTPFAIEQPGGQAWIRVGDRAAGSTRVRPPGVPAIDQRMLRERAAMVAPALHQALARTAALRLSAEMVGPLLGPAEAPSRRAFAALLPWAPIIEPVAYKAAASIAISLDLMRPHLAPFLDGAAAARTDLPGEYWQRLHAMAQFNLLAADAAAAPWLGEMADQFAWSNWTPSFALLRERTSWLAAIAAHAAAAFGERVVSKYVAVIEGAGHPFKTFDALFGLAAIALAHPRAAPGIAAEVRRLRAVIGLRNEASNATLLLSFDDALAVIEGRAPWASADAADVGWRQSSSLGLATAAALRADPAAVVASGHLRGFAILPQAIATPRERFNPERAVARIGRPMTPPHVVTAVLKATWGASSPVSPTLH